MNSVEFNPLSPEFVMFKSYFLGEEDIALGKLFVSVFDGWLSEVEYDSKVKEILPAERTRINNVRLSFFKEFFPHSVIFDSRQNEFVKTSNMNSFIEKCKIGLDDSEEFLIYDYKHRCILNTSYDFTDVCYYNPESDLESIKKIARQHRLYSFG